jgi:predicted methyltransferase
VRWTPWTGAAGSLGAPESVDLLLTARNIHYFMWTPGLTEKVLKDFHAVLKPGGLLAIEDHRADPRPQVPNAQDGYVSTSVMVAMVEKAGFKLEASSEINANPKDTKDYPLGVWTLPPTSTRVKLGYIATWPGQQPIDALRDAAAYVAIGESDRMTLRFRKLN